MVNVETGCITYSELRSRLKEMWTFVQMIRYEYMGENKSAFQPEFGKKFLIAGNRSNGNQFLWNGKWRRFMNPANCTAFANSFIVIEDDLLIEYKYGKITEDTRIEKV
jgi:hypothetical protein